MNSLVTELQGIYLCNTQESFPRCETDSRLSSPSGPRIEGASNSAQGGKAIAKGSRITRNRIIIHFSRMEGIMRPTVECLSGI
jgi:hypothetical protein